MLKVEQKIRDFTEEQLKKAYDEFKEFTEEGQIGESLIRDLDNEHRSEICVATGYWRTVELMVMGEIARRYYTKESNGYQNNTR